jgi:signal transduction histidine kinase
VINGETGAMLRTATWLLRVVVVVLIGVATFTGSTADHRVRYAQIAAYAAAIVLLGLWRVLERAELTDAIRLRLLTVLLAALTIGSAPSSTTRGGGLIAFAMMAAIAAGSEPDLMVGWTVLATGVLAIEIGAVISGGGALDLIESPLLVVAALLLGHNRRSYRIQADQSAVLLEQAQQLKDEHDLVVVLDERARIAREIHDVLAHSLGALSIQIQASRALLSDQHDVDRALSGLDTAQRMVTDGLTETRRAVMALRNDTQPLADELTLLLATHRERHRVAATLEVVGETRPLGSDARLALVRTAQEALVNAAKHSAGEPVSVRLGYDDAETSMTISNLLGPGGDATDGFGTIDGGYGLVGMRERILLIGGTLSVGSEDGLWVVTATVPQ